MLGQELSIWNTVLLTCMLFLLTPVTLGALPLIVACAVLSPFTFELYIDHKHDDHQVLLAILGIAGLVTLAVTLVLGVNSFCKRTETCRNLTYTAIQTEEGEVPGHLIAKGLKQ